MPTRVKSHWSHTSKGKRVRVRSFVRFGPEHTAKWKRLVVDLRKRGNVKSPEAVATSVLGKASFKY
jgi:hypothetical protein